MSSKSRAALTSSPVRSPLPPLNRVGRFIDATRLVQESSNGHHSGSFRANAKGSTNGHVSGISNGAVKGLATCHADSDDDDDEFYGAEERSCCSDSEFQDASDTADFGSDSEVSSSSRTHGSYRSLVAKVHEEQVKCAALEASLQQERLRVKELEGLSHQRKVTGENGVVPVNGIHTSQNGSMGVLPEHLTPQWCKVSESDIIVARTVAGAVGRAVGKAEAIQELEVELQRKERELSRLRDKLQYWEQMNQEMSQQNTHAIEMLRKRRRMWRTVYRVTYVAGAVALGVGILAALNLASSSRPGSSERAELSAGE